MLAAGRKLIPFDIEVFKEDFLFIAYDTEKNAFSIIHNNPQKMREFWEENRNEIWISYNGRAYDIPVIQTYMFFAEQTEAQKHAKETSDKIINSHNNEEERFRIPKSCSQIYPIINYDCMLDVQARALSFGVSLKKLEAYMGFQIEETKVDFTIDRKLTAEELNEVIYYCKWDVKSTWNVFQEMDKLGGDFRSHMGLIEMFDLPIYALNKTKAQLSAEILEARQPDEPRDDEFNFVFPDTLRLDKYAYIKDWYARPENRSYDRKLITNVGGVKHVYAWGGLHAARPFYKGEGCFILADVSSYYPNLMIQYDYLSRNVKDKNKFKEIVEKRLEYKRLKDPRADSSKVLINSVYGASKSQLNGLYDPVMANNVCIGGMLLLTDLIEKTEPISKLIQSNTDGILLKCEKKDKDELIDICHEWEKRVRMTLSFDEYTKVIQRDVNNYIIVDENGNIEAMGTDCKFRTPLDNETAIIGEAMRQYYVNGVPVADTIYKCNNYMDFMATTKLSNKYYGFSHRVGGGTINLPGKTHRVFATTDLSYGQVKKIPKVDDVVKKEQSPLTKWVTVPDETDNQEVISRKRSKIGKIPPHVMIDNSDVRNKPIPSTLDKNYYVEEAMRRIKQWGIPFESDK